MKNKKVVTFCPKPQPLVDRSQKQIIEERRTKRKDALNKLKRKDQ